MPPSLVAPPPGPTHTRSPRAKPIARRVTLAETAEVEGVAAVCCGRVDAGGGEFADTRVGAGEAKGEFGSVEAVVALRGLRGERTPVSAGIGADISVVLQAGARKP